MLEVAGRDLRVKHRTEPHSPKRGEDFQHSCQTPCLHVEADSRSGFARDEMMLCIVPLNWACFCFPDITVLVCCRKVFD